MFAGAFCACGGVAAFVYYEITACADEGSAPVETTVAELDCSGATIAIVNQRTTTNWLAGVYRDEAVLRVVGHRPIDIPVEIGRMRTWIPEAHLPPHVVDGDASETGFELYLDPATVPGDTATRVESCLIGRRGELVEALHASDALRYRPDPAVEEGIVYWRAPEAALEPIFTAPNGETIQLQDDTFWHQATNVGYLCGQATRESDGSIRVAIALEEWGQQAIANFRTSDGEDLEAWFGVPITPEFDELR